MLYLLFPHSVSCNHIVNENAHNRNLRNSYVMEELHSYIENNSTKKTKQGKNIQQQQQQQQQQEQQQQKINNNNYVQL